MGQTTQPATQPASTRPAGEVEVTVNGQVITAGDVDRAFDELVLPQMRAGNMPPDRVQGMRESYRPRLVKELIERKLLVDPIKAAGIEITEQELLAEFDRGLAAYLAQQGLTREEFADQIKERAGKTLEEFRAERAGDPMFRKSILYLRLFEKKFPDELAVTDEQIREQYEKNRRRYDKPAMVRASHILIRVQEGEDEEAARKKIEEILVEARKPDADFAALAREHSSCPSKSKGGDLDFFTRERMVPPFAEAAFSMKVGEISDVVQTQFGFHIIKVTDRQEATTISLEQADDAIREEIKSQHLRQIRDRYLAELQDKATIVYPPGKEPATQPASRTLATRPGDTAATRPGRVPLRSATRPAARTP